MNQYCSVCGQTHNGTGCPEDRSIYDQAVDAEAGLKEQLGALTAERDKVREALLELSRVARAALKQTEGGGE